LKKTLNGRYTIDAYIGASKVKLISQKKPRYKVRFIIPATFPFKVVEVEPLVPKLQWYPHQNGNWPQLEELANIICPPKIEDIFIEELLLPYVRHAYAWITDAVTGSLTTSGERYEVPHIPHHKSQEKVRFYVEGGQAPFLQISKYKSGGAIISKISDKSRDVYRVISMIDNVSGHKWWHSQINKNHFGSEICVGIIPWIYGGSPIHKEPHQPPIGWSDLSKEAQKLAIGAIRITSKYETLLPFLLIGFSIPQIWGEEDNTIVWFAVKLNNLFKDTFVKPKNFRKKSPLRNWPKVASFVNGNNQLRWIPSTDISKEFLLVRKEHDFHKNLRVAVIGIGSVGSMISKSLLKSTIYDLVLIDKETLEPGNFARHEATSSQVELPKSFAMQSILQPAHETRDVDWKMLDAIDQWDEVKEIIQKYDLIIDATGNQGVHDILLLDLELRCKKVMICYIKPGPDFGLVFLRNSESSMVLEGALEQLRESLEEKVWIDFEKPDGKKNQLLEPSPGCYHPTFYAPYHRLRMMADGFLTALLSWIELDDCNDFLILYRQSQKEGYLGYENKIEQQVKLS
jgi:hypothetical protein